jgi:Mg-chelatase subunit ChlD
MIVLLGMVAFSVDLGYMFTVQNQLQAAADAAALAAASRLASTSNVFPEAQQFASYNSAGTRVVNLRTQDVEVGMWQANARTFTPGANGNAVRVTARCDEVLNGRTPFFFAKIFGQTDFKANVSAVAVCNPRDIAFVVDLSGSMNDDTEPCWATAAITSVFGPQGYPNVANELMQDLFTDLGFGAFPGTLAWVGAGKVAADSNAYVNLTATGGPLTLSSIASTYRILSSDSEATRKTKAYKWIIDNQLASLMPAARPVPSSTSSYAHWEKYLDYVIQSVSAGSRGTLPPNQDTNRLSSYNNPNPDTFPGAANANGWRNQLGYRTYTQFLMDSGRDLKPDGSTFMQHSVQSAHCPYHTENTAGGAFSFPPREQPTHATRRALIAAIQVIKERNQNISDPNQRDWVSVITFDRKSIPPVIQQSLTHNYDAAMLACTKLQAVGDIGASTTTEYGLQVAKQHLTPTSQGGQGRENVNRIVVLLTDGVPNDYVSSTTTINNFIAANPSSDYYASNKPAYNGPLMQTMQMQLQNWRVYAVGTGLGADYGFLDRMGRMGSTADDNGLSPRGTGNPAQYEQRLAEIFQQIIDNPRVRLVQ